MKKLRSGGATLHILYISNGSVAKGKTVFLPGIEHLSLSTK
jgi:hypothetical protein